MMELTQLVAEVENIYKMLACSKHSINSIYWGEINATMTFSFQGELINIVILSWNHFSVKACGKFPEIQLLICKDSFISPREFNSLKNVFQVQRSFLTKSHYFLFP